jgi:hypothetical protein
MTKEDWKKLEDWWGNTFYSYFKMECDGHVLSMHNYTYKMRVYVALYVDGVHEGAWTEHDHEMGRKFYPLKRAALYSAVELKMRKKLYGRNAGKQVYKEYRLSYWVSFAAFRKQIRLMCKDVKIIENE